MHTYQRIGFPFAAALAAAIAPAQRDLAWNNNLAFPPTPTFQAGQLALDPLTNQLVLLRSNGQTLAWNGTALATVGTTGPSLSGVAIATSLVPGQTGVLAFGGMNGQGQVLGQTFLWQNGVWMRRFPTTVPPARTRASMASLGGTPVLFGGLDAAGQPLDDLWLFVRLGANWEWLEVFSPPAPPARFGAALCPDGAGGLLLFGGQTGSTLLGDTWRFDGLGWTQVQSPVSPPPGTGPLSYDPIRNEVVHVDPIGRATYRFDPAPARWQLLPAPGNTMSSPFAAMTSGGPSFMAFDPARGEHVFVDFVAGVSVLGSAGAYVGAQQPPSCPHVLAMSLAGGMPRLGRTYSIEINGAPGGDVWLAVATDRILSPAAPTLFGCQVFVDGLVLLLHQWAPPTGRAAFAITVPNLPALVGFEALHQAADFVTGGISHQIVVTVGR